ncbi:TonB-dependent receptor [Niastella sp. OAS944]|uniref:TonB-dependent receptor n=1 Tax=Niastella sp. OAS944 TaxID=2664089 RepID=UPI00348B1844|nr:TonB-linked SusC/RagA family outer membrane protein [Chitinophagaceae bacterium OAS944]
MKNIFSLVTAIMKVSAIPILLLLTSFCSLAKVTTAQDVLAKNVTISVSNKELKSVLKDVSKMTGAKFLYSREIIQSDRRITISVKDKPLADFLGQVLTPLHISYEMDKNGYIFLNNTTTVQSLAASDNALFDENTGYEALTAPPPGKLTGKVVAEDGNVIVSANIQIKGTSRGTATNKEGLFELNINDDDKVLIISAVGYEKQEVTIGKETKFLFILKPQIANLDDVVVIGYGTQKRKDVNSSIVSIKAEDLKNLPQTGIDQMLQGKASGVTVTQNSGAPGGGVSVKIRGISTFGGTEPLYVIDGVPLNGNFNKDAISFVGDNESNMSALAYLNPSDILSVDILKDASATSIYGNQGANGVIIITTKKGKAGDGKITFDAYYGVASVSKYLDLLDLKGYASYKNSIADFIGQERQPQYNNVDLLGSGTDWQREIFKSSAVQNYQLALSGGKLGTTYYVSGNYYDQEGTIIGSGLKRKTIRVNIDNQIKPWLKLGINGTYGSTEQKITLTNNSNNSYGNVIAMAIQQSPDVPVKNIDGTYGGPSDITGLGAMSGGNPVAQATTWHTLLTKNKLQSNIYVQAIFLKDFSFRSDFGSDLNWNLSDAFMPTFTWGRSINELNTYKVQNGKTTYWNWRNVVNWQKRFKEHDLSVMIGQEAQKYMSNTTLSARSKFASNELYSLNLGDPTTASSSQNLAQNTQESYFSRIIYTYDNRYSFTANLRRDRTSKFAPGHQVGYFPGLSASWTVSNEDFFKQFETVNYLKLRAGYGEIGNQNVPNYVYGSALSPAFASSAAFGTGLGQYVSNYANPNVTWEHQAQTNFGIDLGIARQFEITVDVYNKISDKFLFAATYPTFTGTGIPNSGTAGIAAPYVNFGKMQNKGYDISFIYHTPKQSKIEWKSTLVFSHYKNIVKELNSQTSNITQVLSVNGNPPVTRTVVGQAVGLFYGYETAGLFQTPEQLYSSAIRSGNDRNAKNGTYLGDIQYRDQDKSGAIDGDDRVIIGNPNPKFTFGFTNNLSYKNFDATIFITGTYGNDIFNYTRVWGEGMSASSGNQMASVKDRWTFENTNTSMPRYANADPNENGGISNRFIEDGTYLRIQNITLGYNFSPLLQKRFKYISRIRAYVSVQNLYTFTDYSGYDPEVGPVNGNVFLSGIDLGRYPVPRTITGGINVEF